MSLGIVGWVVYVLCFPLAVIIVAHVPFWLNALVYALRRDPYARRTDYTPPVSIVKPVRGLARDDEKNFESFFSIDYPVFEILFVIHEEAGDDPAIPVIQGLIDAHPGVDARIIRSPVRVAVHEKVNNYIHAIAQAKYEIINITDADCYVLPDHLRREVRPLSDEQNAIVFSIQTMNHFQSAPSAFEGLYQNGDYPVVVQFFANINLLRFVVGHTLVFRKAEFYAFGAIDVLKNHISDDDGWGEIMVRRGRKRIWLSRTITHTRYPRATWKTASDHIIRWGAFFWHFSPLYVFAPLLQNSSLGLMTLVLALFVDPAVTVPFSGRELPLGLTGIVVGAGTLVVRTLSIAISNLLYGDSRRDLRYFWTIPLRDIYTLCVCLAAPFQRSFTHAGRTYRIRGRRMVTKE